MNTSTSYISRVDFNERHFKKINRKIEVCLKLIERLVKFNKECEEEVIAKLNVENYIIDYRVEQFQYYHQTLAGIYYGCYSPKHVYDISTMMNFNKVKTTIGIALATQQSHITFAGIVQMSSMLEYTRKDFEKNIKGSKGSNYLELLKEKYPKLGSSLELLNHFRNTIHLNGKWSKDKPLEYHLRNEKVSIKKGEQLQYDYWTLYKIVRDCIELSKILALDNEPNFIRETRLRNGGDKAVVLNTKIDIKKLFEDSRSSE